MTTPTLTDADTAAALAQLHAGAESLWQAAAPLWPGLSVEVMPAIDSSNAELMRRARAGQTEPMVLAAVHQHAGRGRLGRPWITLPGASLAFSIGAVLAPADWSGLSLAVGVAVAEALSPAVQLKWPNDLWWNGRKLGGILIETAAFDGAAAGQRYAVIGIGLNLATPTLPPDAPADALPPAGLRELAQALGQPAPALGATWAAVAAAVLRALPAFEREGFAPWAARYAARDALRGRGVRLSDGGEGVADGVAPDGALRVRSATGLRHVHQGEVSVRPC
ncbi:biotin--[acetyl-CoA-carboxylase] ligase [Tepidimonas taiwanensis]|uniref:biotin--[acetyl-CoA-carboxylase] ligase n=1 Tax=Tepidimonas taiwanensis TaxID=307486 RepID=UPI00073493C1|nr:biotin--[acetyl-CoA-carboxylase] ligase [Tepidimonas taiwanensis]